jgi:hypothetical protein
MIRATQAQTAWFILNKNFLAGPKAPGLVELVEALAGLPGQPTLTPLLAAHIRLADFSPSQLFHELYQQRRLIKSMLMRSAGYLAPVERFLTFHAATARQRNQDFNSEFRLWGVDNSEMTALEQAILARQDWPATAETITAGLPPALVRPLSQTSRGGRVSVTSNVALALRWLAAKGVLGINEQSKNLATRAEKPGYAPLRHWYPQLDLSAAPGEAEAQAALVQAYLAAFGPATEADISFWSGFGKSETGRAVAALAAKTTLILVEGIPGMLLLLKEQAEALQATQPPDQPLVHFLPADDPFTTAYRASRSRYFSDQKLQRHIFDSAGVAAPAIVVNGQVVGRWAWSNNQLTWELLAEIDPALQPLIQAEAERLRAFLLA